MDRIDLFREYLFREKSFKGNTEDYYNPENSYLTSVLDSGKGIPVSLSVLAILVARRVDLPLEGVNLPGHFIVRYDSPDLRLFLDPFNEGRAKACPTTFVPSLSPQRPSDGFGNLQGTEDS